MSTFESTVSAFLTERRTQGDGWTPFQDLHRVWPTSPYGKLRGDPHDSVPSLAEQIKKKKKGKR